MADWGAQYGRNGGQRSAARLRSLRWFLLAGVYAVLSQQCAERLAPAIASGPAYLLVNRFLFLALLLVGFAVMGRLGQQQTPTGVVLGLPRRLRFGREWALGAALGWGGIVACVLPVALTGGLLVTMGQHGAAELGALLLDLATLLLAALADEVFFRGYAFQRLIEVVGPGIATIVVTLFFVLGNGGYPRSSSGSVLVTLLLGFLLASAYLRTRALWVGWGFHFAWNASMAILFGLPVSGLTSFSPVISTYASGPAWLTGGGYGPEASAMAVVVLLVLLFVMASATRELRHQWAIPEIVGAGIPVDIDEISRRQHEAGMGPVGVLQQPLAGTQLVQIAPAAPSTPLLREPEPPDS